MLRATFALLSGVGLLTACSFVNAPDEIQPGGGGEGNTGNGNGATGNVGPGGGGAGGGGAGGGGAGGAGPPVCGDGVLHALEVCDDANLNPGDACSPDCLAVTEFDVAPPNHEWPGVGTSGLDGGKGFFVAFRQNGAGPLEIRGRGYSAAGTPQGEQMPLSLAANPSESRIGTNSSGRSVVAWHEQGGASAVHFRVIGPDGQAEGTEVVIPGTVASSFVSVGTSTTDEFALAWNSPTNTANVRALNPTGALVGINQLLGPSIATSLPGVWGVSAGFVAAWTDGAGGLTGIQLTKTGSPLDGTQFPISSETAVSSNSPYGAFVGPTNQFIAVFEKPLTLNGVTQTRVFRRRFNDLGQSAEVDVSASAVHVREYHSRVARHAATGNFVVVWAADNPDCNIFARVFDPSGNVLGDAFQVNQVVAGCQSWPGVAVNVDGDAMFVWDNYPQDAPFRVSAVIHPRLLVN